MTREEARRWAELFAAYADGKTIERLIYNVRLEMTDWVMTEFIDSTERVDHYRIKEEKI